MLPKEVPIRWARASDSICIVQIERKFYHIASWMDSENVPFVTLAHAVHHMRTVSRWFGKYTRRASMLYVYVCWKLIFE